MKTLILNFVAVLMRLRSSIDSWINFVLKDQILTMKQCVNRPH